MCVYLCVRTLIAIQRACMMVIYVIIKLETRFEYI